MFRRGFSVGKSVFKFIGHNFNKHPITANALVGGALFAAGDLICQNLERRRYTYPPPYEWIRIGRMGFFGVISGPPHYIFYKYLDRYYPGRGRTFILKKMVLDVVITSPCFSMQFLIGMSLLEGKSFKESLGEFLEKFPRIFMADLFLWPPFQYINFYCIHPKHRVLYVNCVTVLWNVFLSFVKHNDINKYTPEKLAEMVFGKLNMTEKAGEVEGSTDAAEYSGEKGKSNPGQEKSDPSKNKAASSPVAKKN